jgi:endonuclease/exonuclease/phosphatase family metal-dependent hydrolase
VRSGLSGYRDSVIRKLALVGGVGAVWLVTFIVMGGSKVPSIDFNATSTSSGSTPQAGPAATVTPIGPASPTPSDSAPTGVASKAEALASTAPITGPTLQARPKPRRSLPPSLTFRIATFNVLGSSHTSGNQPRASGVTRMNAATSLILDRGFSIVGFQEMQSDQRAAFVNKTDGAWELYPGGTQHSGDGDNSIGFRKDTWELLNASSIATPYFYGRTRHHPVLLLRNKQTGIRIYVVNFHSPADKHGNAQKWRDITTTREIGLYNQLAKQGIPILVTGDMNERNTYGCRVVTESDMRAAIGGDGRNGCTVPHNPFVDWILGSYDVTFSHYDPDNNVGSITDHPVISVDATVNSRDFPKSVS